MKFSILCFLFLLFSFHEMSAQGPYFIPSNGNIPVANTSVNSMDIESADVDGDGDLDLVIAGEFRRNLLFINDGSGVFAEDASRLFPEKNVNDGFPGEDSEDIVFADFDQDSDLDILFVSEDSLFHELLVNDGAGHFTFIAFDFPSSTGNAVAVLDLNNDDYPDIIIGNNGQNNVYINNQDLSFTAENNRWPKNSEGTQDLKLIDLDGDADLDIIEGIDLGENNVLINNNGFFTEENNRLPNTGLILETRKISLGDANGDGHSDIYVSTVNFIGTANLQNRLYLNDGNGFFTDATNGSLPTSLQNTLDAVFLDYDDDGDMDLITTDFQNPTGTNYHAFENDGSGVFVETTTDVFEAFGLNTGVSIHSADFNNDSYADLYFGNFQETDDLLLFDPAALTIDDFNSSIDIIAYPNPTKGPFRIASINSMDSSELSIQLHNIKGQLVVEKTNFGKSVQPLDITLDLSHLATGTYFYSLFDDDALITKGKVIKE